MSNPAKQVDPRDLFITRNPTGLTSYELEKGRSGFVDHRTHGDYLVFLSGYEAASGVDPSDESQGQHALIEAEGYKPEISILQVAAPCAAAAVGRRQNEAEGDQPNLNTPRSEPTGAGPANPPTDRAPLSGWISCIDRLPGDQLDGLGVIVGVVNHKGERISELDVWNKGRRQGRFEFWGKRVSHWQPLPAPPGGQQ